MTPVRLEPVALRSRAKHSTTEPLRLHLCIRRYRAYPYDAMTPRLQMALGARKPVFGGLRKKKMQISLRIRAV